MYVSQDVIREITRGRYVKNNLGEKLKESYHVEDQGVTVRKILKWISMKYYLIWTGFILSGQGPQKWNFIYHNRCEISWQAERIFDYREGLYVMKLFPSDL
jgi:hypothetical protein